MSSSIPHYPTELYYSERTVDERISHFKGRSSVAVNAPPHSTLINFTNNLNSYELPKYLQEFPRYGFTDPQILFLERSYNIDCNRNTTERMILSNLISAPSALGKHSSIEIGE